MSRAVNLAAAVIIAVAAVSAAGLHYAAYGLALERGCDVRRGDSWDIVADGVFAADRIGLRLQHPFDGGTLVRALIDHGSEADHCRGKSHGLPYFEDAVALADAPDQTNEALRLEAVEWLALTQTFSSIPAPPEAAKSWRRSLEVRKRSFPDTKLEIAHDDFMLAYSLARECFSHRDDAMMSEARAALDEAIALETDDLDVWDLRGDIAALQGRWSEAERYYRESFKRRVKIEMVPVEGYPGRADTAEKLAIVLGLQGNRAEADAFKKLALEARDGVELTVGRSCLRAPLRPYDISPARTLWPF